MIVLLISVSVILLIISIFLGKELLKKFKFHDSFTSSNGYIQNIKYYWIGTTDKPRMRNIILKGNKPFKVLIGFKLEIALLKFEGTDWFGLSTAKRAQDGNYYSVISTWMGRNDSEFHLLTNSNFKNNIIKIVQVKKINLKPDVACLPHWYQKIGFYS